MVMTVDVSFGTHKVRAVKTIREAVDLFCVARDTGQTFHSPMHMSHECGLIRENGVAVARISFRAHVWSEVSGAEILI